MTVDFGRWVTPRPSLWPRLCDLEPEGDSQQTHCYPAWEGGEGVEREKGVSLSGMRGPIDTDKPFMMLSSPSLGTMVEHHVKAVGAPLWQLAPVLPPCFHLWSTMLQQFTSCLPLQPRQLSWIKTSWESWGTYSGQDLERLTSGWGGNEQRVALQAAAWTGKTHYQLSGRGVTKTISICRQKEARQTYLKMLFCFLGGNLWTALIFLLFNTQAASYFPAQ